MTDKEFFASPVEISVDNNMGFVKECAKVLNPAYRVADRIARRWERIEKRKARLLQQQQEIAKKLNKIEKVIQTLFFFILLILLTPIYIAANPDIQ